MSDSLVNASSINANFPQAGVDNSSQGFRDNFATIKSALNRTAVELSELRSLSVTKSAIDGVTLYNDLDHNKLIRPQLQAYSETFYDNGFVSSVLSLNYNNGNFQKVSTTGPFVVSFTNFPTTTQVGRVILWVFCAHVDHTLSLPNQVIFGMDADYINNQRIQFPAIGNYLLEFISVNNGQQYWIRSISGLAEFGPSGSGAETGTYILPVASVSQLGGVKVDGTTIGIYNGTISVVGSLITSDQTVKENIEPLANPLAINRALNGVSFNYRESGNHSIGLIAQDVERVLPELVQADANGIKSVQYASMAGLFVECIKSLENQIIDLKQEIESLRQQCNKS